NAPQNFIRIKIRFRQCPRRPAMTFIIARNLLGAPHRLVQRAKGQQALTYRIVSAEARVLNQGRLARREVADGSIAEPAAAGFDIDALGSRELGTRALYIAAERHGIAGYPVGVHELPAVFEKGLPIL